jgi:hypothetical protein
MVAQGALTNRVLGEGNDFYAISTRAVRDTKLARVRNPTDSRNPSARTSALCSGLVLRGRR